MIVELTESPFAFAFAAFGLGLILAAIGAGILARQKAQQRDPRDLRIRSLEAEIRVAQANAQQSESKVATLEKELQEIRPAIISLDDVIADQKAVIDQLRLDLTSSVKMTRQLRAELADRATENVHAEVRIREVETELSVVQASTDLISTGVLTYDFEVRQEDEDKTTVLGDSPNRSVPKA